LKSTSCVFDTNSSEYERRALVEKFKREMNEMIRRKLMEAERLSASIEQ